MIKDAVAKDLQEHFTDSVISTSEMVKLRLAIQRAKVDSVIIEAQSLQERLQLSSEGD